MGHDSSYSTAAAGYVAVADEPLHKEIYSDGHFRAYTATIEPGQATDYHRHSEDTVYIVISGGRMRNKNYSGCKRSPMVFPRSFPLYKKLWFAAQNVFTGGVRLPDGLFFFMPTKKHPSIHLAEASPHNRDAVCLMGVEIRYGSAESALLVHNIHQGRVEYDNGMLRVIVCSLEPGTSGEIVVPGYRHFIVCTKGLIEITLGIGPNEQAEHRRLAAGDYLCMSGDFSSIVKTPGNVASELIVLAIPEDVKSRRIF